MKQQLTDEEIAGVVNIALHPALFPSLQDWLDERGFCISPPVTNSQLSGEEPKEDEEVYRFVFLKEMPYELPNA